MAKKSQYLCIWIIAKSFTHVYMNNNNKLKFNKISSYISKLLSKRNKSSQLAFEKQLITVNINSYQQGDVQNFNLLE
jgi:hypothetical protein